MITLITWLTRLVAGLVEYLSQRRLIEAGEAEAIAKVMAETNERIAKAIAARHAVATGSVSTDKDPYQRD